MLVRIWFWAMVILGTALPARAAEEDQAAVSVLVLGNTTSPIRGVTWSA